MGIYLNPKNENFRGFLKSPIYVDKTMMLKTLNDFIDRENKYICISRPRRFGKTIAGEMISAYYSKGCDSHELFSNLKISKDNGYKEKLNKFNVIKIDLNSEYQNTENKKGHAYGARQPPMEFSRLQGQSVEFSRECQVIKECRLFSFSFLLNKICD